MKKITKLMVCLIGLASFSGAIFAGSDSKMSLKVPFEFVAGGKRLPAGTYRLSEAQTGVILIQGDAPDRSIALISTPGRPMLSGASSGVRFERHGADVYLSAVMMEGQLVRFVKAKAPKESGAGAIVAGN